MGALSAEDTYLEVTSEGMLQDASAALSSLRLLLRLGFTAATRRSLLAAIT